MRPVSVSATPGEDWRQTFAGMMLFGFLMLASTVPLRAAGSGMIVAGIRNCALVFLGVSLPLYGWQAARRSHAAAPPANLRPVLLLFANTAAALVSILLFRAAAAKARSLASVSTLDLAGSLLVPVAAGFGLVMLPYISRSALRRAALVLAASCLAATVTLATASRAEAVGGPKGTTASPVRRPGVPLTARAVSCLDTSQPS